MANDYERIRNMLSEPERNEIDERAKRMCLSEYWDKRCTHDYRHARCPCGKWAPWRYEPAHHQLWYIHCYGNLGGSIPACGMFSWATDVAPICDGAKK